MSRLTGGCQCGAVRFACERLGRASICHCRMCQKAFGSFFGPYVDALGFRWTRGAPKHFRSSNQVRRGFCGDCGTQLSFEVEGFDINIAIGAFDDPTGIEPTVQLAWETKLAYVDRLGDLPHRPESAQSRAFLATIVSNQHPDHDT